MHGSEDVLMCCAVPYNIEVPYNIVKPIDQKRTFGGPALSNERRLIYINCTTKRLYVVYR